MRLLCRTILTPIFLVGTLLSAHQFTAAQAYVTSERGSDIAPFAQATLISPDWGPNRNLGFTAGLDYTHFIRSFIQPSLEVRYTSASGDVVNERSYSGGLKLQTSIRNIHPYATFLVGHGNIVYDQPRNGYYGDNSLVYSLGAGAEFNVTQQLRLRLDFTHQNWNIDPQTLTPNTYGVGIAYSLRLPGRRAY